MKLSPLRHRENRSGAGDMHGEFAWGERVKRSSSEHSCSLKDAQGFFLWAAHPPGITQNILNGNQPATLGGVSVWSAALDAAFFGATRHARRKRRQAAALQTETLPPLDPLVSEIYEWSFFEGVDTSIFQMRVALWVVATARCRALVVGRSVQTRQPSAVTTSNSTTTS